MLNSGEHIPRLTDALSIIPIDTVAQIELKETGIAADVADIVTESKIDIRVSSFSERALAEVAQSSLDAPTGYLFKDDPDQSLDLATELGCSYVHPHINLCLMTDIVSAAHHRGFKVLAWNTDNAEIVGQLQEVNVDGVTVDQWGAL